ncbi:MAG: sulfur carrier protein ThiS [Succinivibrionaceae bacterium]
MKITLNGKDMETEGSSLRDILIQENIIEDPKQVYGIAVTVNEKIVSKKNIASFEIAEGDIIEVFTMVAGG